MAESKTKRLKLTRSIILNKQHAEKGSIHEVPVALAHRLVGEGSAEHVDPQDAATSVTGEQGASNSDTATKQVHPGSSKAKAAK